MPNKAIFLDRDGVLINNSNHYYIWEKEQMQYVDGVFKHLKMFIKKGFQLFVVSNQGGISKGLYTKEDIWKLHEEMSKHFLQEGIEFTEIAFCPHHNEIEKCLCRKPQPLMIEKLIAKYHISKSDSYFIGDSKTDLEAAKQAGIRGIKITGNQDMFPFISFLIK